jgi:glycosyltransferase involved in cell wall biosynthesis
MPFFSIIIPTFNRAHILSKAVGAVLTQSFHDWELIIADDGSTDDTEKMIADYLKDTRIIYQKQNNKGVCAARNLGSTFAKGEYLIFLDSDDQVDADWLLDFHTLLSCGLYDVGFCNMKELLHDGSERMVNAMKPYANSDVQGKYIAGMFAIRKSVFDAVGGYDELLRFGENTELGIRLRMKEVRMGFVQACHFFYHVSVDGGGKNLHNKCESNIRIVEKHPSYFRQNPQTKKLFLQVAAVAAAKLGNFKKAREIFKGLKNDFPNDKKIRMQFLISGFPILGKFIWKPVKPYTS